MESGDIFKKKENPYHTDIKLLELKNTIKRNYKKKIIPESIYLNENHYEQSSDLE